MTREEARAGLRQVVNAIVEVVRDAGPMGAPGGLIYLALMNKGASYEQYQQIMAGIVDAGLIERHGDCYVAKAQRRA